MTSSRPSKRASALLSVLSLILDASHARIVAARSGLVSLPTQSPTQVHLYDAEITPVILSPAQAQAELRRRSIAPTLDVVSGYTALGCYEDGSNNILTVTWKIDVAMTPELCRNMCSLASCGIFGVENADECFCGQTIEAFAVSATPSDCSSACFGSSAVLCGGENRINLYSATEGPLAGQTGAAGASSATTTGTSAGTGAANAASTAATATGATGTAEAGSGSDSSSGSGSHSGSNSGSDTSSSDVTISIGGIIGIVAAAAGIACIATAIFCFVCCRRGRRSGRDVTGSRDPRPGFYQPVPQGLQQNNYVSTPPPRSSPYEPPPQPYETPAYAKTEYGRPAYSAVSPLGTEAMSPSMRQPSPVPPIAAPTPPPPAPVPTVGPRADNGTTPVEMQAGPRTDNGMTPVEMQAGMTYEMPATTYQR